MGLLTAYLVTTKNLEPLLNSLTTARAPETFTQKFLQGLEFKSTNDRLYIGVLKGLGFLTETSAPTDRYYAFLDQAQSKRVLAEAIREAYSDLFDVNIQAHTMTETEVKNKLKTLTQGKYSENVVSWMAKTFRGLADYADWSESTVKKVQQEQAAVKDEKHKAEPQMPAHNPPTPLKPETGQQSGGPTTFGQLHYNIQIHLPESRDSAVYDAIFKSLRSHLGD